MRGYSYLAKCNPFAQFESGLLLLMVTIPVVIYGIMRYEALIFENRSEAPEKLFLTDKELVGSAILWTGLVVWILYSGVTRFG